MKLGLKLLKEMIAKYFLLAFMCLATLVSCRGDDVAKKKLAEVDQLYRAAEERARNGTLVGPVSVSALISRFLLVRNGPHVCALRFTDIHRGGDARPPTWWQEGGESEYAEYDWYYQGDGSGDFTKSNVESDHRKLYQKPAVGIGGLLFPRGRNAIRCGSFPSRLGWSYPSHVWFHTTNRREDDVGNELAPTKWKEISEVNVHDSRLKWYRYDEERKRTYIPLDKLW